MYKLLEHEESCLCNNCIDCLFQVRTASRVNVVKREGNKLLLLLLQGCGKKVNTGFLYMNCN